MVMSKSLDFFQKIELLVEQKRIFYFCNSGVINVWMCCVESIPPGPLIKKFCLVGIGLNPAYGFLSP